MNRAEMQNAVSRFGLRVFRGRMSSARAAL